MSLVTTAIKLVNDYTTKELDSPIDFKNENFKNVGLMFTTDESENGDIYFLQASLNLYEGCISYYASKETDFDFTDDDLVLKEYYTLEELIDLLSNVSFQDFYETIINSRYYAKKLKGE